MMSDSVGGEVTLKRGDEEDFSEGGKFDVRSE